MAAPRLSPVTRRVEALNPRTVVIVAARQEMSWIARICSDRHLVDRRGACRGPHVRQDRACHHTGQARSGADGGSHEARTNLFRNQNARRDRALRKRPRPRGRRPSSRGSSGCNDNHRESSDHGNKPHTHLDPLPRRARRPRLLARLFGLTAHRSCARRVVRVKSYMTNGRASPRPAHLVVPGSTCASIDEPLEAPGPEGGRVAKGQVMNPVRRLLELTGLKPKERKKRLPILSSVTRLLRK